MAEAAQIAGRVGRFSATHAQLVVLRSANMEAVREIWSDDRLDILDRKVDEGFSHVDRRFEEVDRRFAQVDQRFEEAGRRFEQVDQRFGEMDRRFGEVAERVGRVEGELTELRTAMESKFERIGGQLDDLKDQMVRLFALMAGASCTLLAAVVGLVVWLAL